MIKNSRLAGLDFQGLPARQNFSDADGHEYSNLRLATHSNPMSFKPTGAPDRQGGFSLEE